MGGHSQAGPVLAPLRSAREASRPCAAALTGTIEYSTGAEVVRSWIVGLRDSACRGVRIPQAQRPEF